MGDINNSEMIMGLVSMLAALVFAIIIFLLNKTFDNRKSPQHDTVRDQDLSGIYSQLLHLSTLMTKLDMGMDETIRTLQDSDSKISTVRMREEFRAFRVEINDQITDLRKVVYRAEKLLRNRKEKEKDDE